MNPHDLIYEEAELLDRRELDAWLHLYTDDCVYWIPQRDGDDPERDVSIVYDDWTGLRGRVVRLTSGFAYAQDPPSGTCHMIGNVRVSETSGGTVAVTSSLVLVESRRGSQQVYAGRVEHLLVNTGTGGRIQRKTIWLTNADTPLGNLSFLV